MRWQLLVLIVFGGAFALTSHAQPTVSRVEGASLEPLRARLGLLPAGVEVSEPVRVPTARPFRPKRFWYGLGGAVAIDVPVAYALSQLWYPDSLRTSFHFYSDNPNVGGAGGAHDDGWLDDWHTYVQQDKLGHVWTAWYLARAFGAYGRWSGLSDARVGLFGGVMSTLFQTQIEISDGFSEEYGFSRTDMLANFVGSAIGGLKVAHPERLDWFAAKYSYHRSPYYDESISNPVLGYLGNAIKDYDGASFWLVFRPEELLPERHAAWWPDWLAISAGYSADGITHAISGQRERRLGPGPGREHQRVFFIGPDFDFLRRLDVPKPWSIILEGLSFIRIPAPALQLTPGLEWHWLYY